MGARSISWSGITILIVLSLIMAGPRPAGAQAPKRCGTLQIAYGNDIANLDFHTAPGYEMMWVAMNRSFGVSMLVSMSLALMVPALPAAADDMKSEGAWCGGS